MNETWRLIDEHTPKDAPILVGLADGAWSYEFGYWWASEVNVMVAVWIESCASWVPPNGEAVPDMSGGFLTEFKPLSPDPTHWMPLPTGPTW